MKNLQWQECIDSCLACMVACNHCLAECLKEKDVNMMAKCIELDIQCALICEVSAQFMSLNSPHAATLCTICADICEKCAAECESHHAQHCKDCAEACRACAAACRKMAA